MSVTADYVNDLASKAGLALQPGHGADYGTMFNDLDAIIADLPDDLAVYPRPDLAKYPRTDVHVPENTVGGGWATKATIKSTAPTSSLLQGKTLAIKDNVAVAGVRCTNGTTMVDWTPEYDATIVTRILDAGGLILGKAACENCCMEGISRTSCTGRVHNPYAPNYSAGGSSSGSGALVGAGAVDMAIGGDQGGSIRIPAAHCGIVGHKPTWGLVPYTGILSLDAAIDHAGPMTRNVPDCARLLEAIAGADGWDDRQPALGLEVGSERTKFVEKVESTLAKEGKAALEGVRVGILREGFQMARMDPNVAAAVRSAAEKFAALGASVTEVSVPAHSGGMGIWSAALPLAGGRQALLGDLDGRKQFSMTDRGKMISPKKLSQREFDAMGPGCRMLYMKWLHCEEKYGASLTGRVANLIKGLTDAYDKALQDVDVLVMPTVAKPPHNLGPEDTSSMTPGEANAYFDDVVCNTSPFDSTGHPGLSLPCGFVPAVDNDKIKLPTGMMLVGRKFDDATVLQAAAAWEKAYDWKTL